MIPRAIVSEDWAAADPDGKVLLLLHGYGSHERDLAGLAPYLPAGLPWASVRAPLEMGYGGAAWFPLDGDWLAPGPIEAATDHLWDWIDSNASPYSPVAALGFSQGGLMASQLLRTRPDRVTDVVICSGFVLDIPQPGDEALTSSRPAVYWGRGDKDQVVPPHLAAASQQWLEAHSTLDSHVYPGLAHSISAEQLTDIGAYLTRA